MGKKRFKWQGPDAGPDWLRQFDAVLPGYSLKSQLDILSLLKQVGLGEGSVLRRRFSQGKETIAFEGLESG